MRILQRSSDEESGLGFLFDVLVIGYFVIFFSKKKKKELKFVFHKAYKFCLMFWISKHHRSNLMMTHILDTLSSHLIYNFLSSLLIYNFFAVKNFEINFVVWDFKCSEKTHALGFSLSIEIKHFSCQ